MESASFYVGYEYNRLYGSAVYLPGECGDWLGGFPLLFVGSGGVDGGELGNMLGSFLPLIKPVRFCADFTLESVPSSILLSCRKCSSPAHTSVAHLLIPV